jgi:hypothetical protein
MSEDLTTMLARKVMRWSIAPERLLLGRRGWIPRWRFQPTEKLEDAFRLLEEAAPGSYTMRRDGQGPFCVQVQIGEETGTAEDPSKPRAITLAIARALKLRVDE